MSAQNTGTTDYGITRGIDYSDAQALADAIDRSTPEDFTGGAGGIGGQVTEGLNGKDKYKITRTKSRV